MTISCKQKDLTSIPVTHMKRPDIKAYAHNLRSGDGETGRSLGFNGLPS